MTKTNKTLLCVLLAMVLTFALALTALTTTAQTATAEGEKTYTKVTENLTDWSGEYLVVYENSATKAYVWNGTDDASGYTEATIVNNSIVTSDAVSVTIAKTTNGYSIKVNSGDNSGKYAGQTSDGNGLKFQESAIDNAITYESGSAKIVSAKAVLRFNAANNQMRFRYYKSTSYTSQKAIQLYKLVEDACEHDLVEVPAVAATCTEAGNNAYYKCNLCGKFFADAEAATATTAEEQAIPALGHKYNWTLDPADTTKKNGTCSVCGDVKTGETTAIANIYVNGVLLTGNNKEGTISIGNQTGLVASIGNEPVYPGESFILTITGANDTVSYIVSHLDEDNIEVKDSTITAFIAVPAELMDEFRITVMVNCAHAAKQKHKGIEATCLTEGKEEYWECPDCGVLSSTEDMASVISAPITIAKLDHAYGSDHVCTNGCGKTQSVNLVEEANNLAEGEYLGGSSSVTYTIIGVVKSISGDNIIITVEGSDSLEITLYKTTTSADTAKVGDKVTVTGPIMKYKPKTGTAFVEVNGGTYVVSNCDHANATFVAEVPATTETAGTKEHYTCPDCNKQLVKNGETYTEVSAQDLVIEPLVIVEITEKITAIDSKAKFDAEANKIYLANGGKLVVTYEISQNSGVNALMFTLHYNKDLFKVESIVANTELGNAIEVTGNEVDTLGVYKVLLEGLAGTYNEKYTGLLVTVTYVYVGNLTSFEDADTAFGLDNMEAHKSNTDGTTTPVGTKAVLSDVAYDVIKQASITLNDQVADSQIEVTYNAKELTVDLALNNPTLVVKSESTGKLVCKWYSDAARTTEIAAPTNVGTYYLTVTIEATPAYEQSTASFTIVINPYQIDYDSLSVSANPNDKALVGGTATWAESDIVVGGLAGLPDATGVYTITYGTLSFTTVGEKEISVIVTITNTNYKFVSASGFATGDSETVYNGKATVSVSAKAISLVLPTLEDKYYDGVAISLTGITASVEGESLTVSVEVTVNGSVLTNEQLATYIVNAGTYNIAVRAWVEGNDNYKQVTGNLSVTISKLTLFIDASKIVYNGSVVSWEAVTKAYKANETELVDIADLGVSVTYQVTNGEGHDYDGSTSFNANTLATVAQLTLKAIPGDTTNFNVGSQGLKMVYQVLFAASTEPAVAESKVNVFEGEVVSAPSVSAEGYRFDAWYNGETAYDFDTAVTTNLTLVAKWVKQITITWYGEDGTSVLKTVTADVNTVVKFDGETPTKAATDYIDYAFEKWVDTTDATKLYDLENEFTLTADISVKATFKGTVVRMSVSYKVMGGDGNVLDEKDLGIKAVGTAEIGLPELTNYKWHKVSAWMNGATEFTTVVADELDGEHKIVLVATYTFNIGLGDVDGNGTVDTDDIVLYRKHIVGGYDITVVTDAWTTAMAADFDESKVYFLAQVANVDGDESNTNDVRDVSTIRMALVGGYGYTTKDGAVVKGNGATTQSAKVQYKQVLAPMGLFGKKFAL